MDSTALTFVRDEQSSVARSGGVGSSMGPVDLNCVARLYMQAMCEDSEIVRVALPVWNDDTAKAVADARVFRVNALRAFSGMCHAVSRGSSPTVSIGSRGSARSGSTVGTGSFRGVLRARAMGQHTALSRLPGGLCYLRGVKADKAEEFVGRTRKWPTVAKLLAQPAGDYLSRDKLSELVVGGEGSHRHVSARGRGHALYSVFDEAAAGRDWPVGSMGAMLTAARPGRPESSSEMVSIRLGGTEVESGLGRGGLEELPGGLVDCKCLIHRAPLRSDVLGTFGCSELPPGSHSAVRAAAEGVHRFCAADPGVRALDERFVAAAAQALSTGRRAYDSREGLPELAGYAASTPAPFGKFGSGYCVMRAVRARFRWRLSRVYGPNVTGAKAVEMLKVAGMPSVPGGVELQVREVGVGESKVVYVHFNCLGRGSSISTSVASIVEELEVLCSGESPVVVGGLPPAADAGDPPGYEEAVASSSGSGGSRSAATAWLSSVLGHSVGVSGDMTPFPSRGKLRGHYVERAGRAAYLIQVGGQEQASFVLPCVVGMSAKENFRQLVGTANAAGQVQAFALDLPLPVPPWAKRIKTYNPFVFLNLSGLGEHGGLPFLEYCGAVGLGSLVAGKD